MPWAPEKLPSQHMKMEGTGHCGVQVDSKERIHMPPCPGARDGVC